ncbi:ABC transporter permease [Mycoplasma miroungigenitalium]|uniref:ABC transporter permease n=1 Tax=Mycoplasma miroungigenitalium TaxID=754515 RepID=UPI001F3C15D6|nr:ABC transporter permease [Mycoplasma miroungigenitalium]
MSLSATEFNKKYGISAELQEKIKISKDDKISNNIAGKPKILLVEILKRFFTNPAVLIAFIVFVAIILISIIVSVTSDYPGVQRIDAGWSSEDKIRNIESLPPMFNRIKETGDQTIINNLETWKNNDLYSPYFTNYVNFTKTSPSTLTYDPYNYYEGAQLWAKIRDIEKSLPQDQSLASVLTDQKLSELVNSIPKLHTYFGTNIHGADIWTTVWKGTLESIWIALFVATVEIIIGVFVGAYLGFNAGKWLDTFMMRVIEIFTSPPSIIWLLLFVTIWGTNPWVLIAGLLFVGWTGPIGVTRLFIITVKDEEYIMAAKSIGASESRRIFLHALPAILGKIAMSYVRRIPSVILSIASLAFLGFFKDDNSANLGKFMLDNLESSKENPWLLFLPALILLGISISLQFIAVGLHDALDPKVIKVKR